MSTLNGQWLEIFRAGDYGDKGSFSNAQLAALAASYNPAKDEAPIVVGHPELDAPAFGWVKQLRLDGDTLMGLPGEVNPDFDSAVKNGAYKKRSVAFTRQADGTLKLRHLGFLGAAAPHIKGLRDAKFSDGKYDEIEFSEGEVMDEAQVRKTVTDTITEFFAKMFGSKETTTLTQADLDAAAKKATDAVEAKFAEDLKKEREAREAIASEFAEHKKTAGSQTAAQQTASLISGLKEKKRWIPAYDAMGVPALFAVLTANESTEVEFGEGDKKQKKAPAQLFADILEGIGKIVPEGTVFAAPSTKSGNAPDANGAVVDPSSVAFNEMVQAHAKEHKVSFTDAYKALAAEGKRPEQGSASAGAV